MPDLPPPPPRVGRAALLGGAAGLFGRATGLLREVVLAVFFGAGMEADAFNAAFRVPNLLRELLAEGSLSNVVVPTFAETVEREGLDRAWALANAILGHLLLVLGGATLAFFVFAEPFVLLVAAGFRDVPGKVELATWLTRILAPFLAGLSVASLFGGMLNVRGRFFLPAMAPSFLNVLVILACAGGGAWERATGTPAIGAVAAASTLSGLLTALVQLPALRREGFRVRPTLRRHPGLGRVLRFMGAAVVGVVVVQFNILVESQLASRLGQGPVSWLTYGFRLVQLPMGVVAGSVAVASLAGLSVHLARGDRDGARSTLSRALEMNSLLVMPAAVGLFLLAHPLIELIFEHGAFTAADTAATAGILRMYAVATVGICVYRVLLPAFFALQDPWLPMKLSVGVMVAKIPLALALMNTAGLGVDGLPLSHAVTVTAEVGVMMFVLRSRLQGWAPGFWGQQGRIAVASAAMGAVVWALRGHAGGFGVVGVSAAGGLAYLGLVVALRVREAGALTRRLRRGR